MSDTNASLPPLGETPEELLWDDNYFTPLERIKRRLAEVEAEATHHLFALAAIRDASPLIGGDFHLLASAQKQIAREAITWKPTPTTNSTPAASEENA